MSTPKLKIRYNKGAVPHEVFSVVNGKDYTILELVDVLNKIMNKDIEPVFTPLRPGDVFKTLADISKAKNLLGYQSKVDFEEGLEKTVEWFKRQQVMVSSK